jgi:predicted nuclease of predicted toxin-antitoxin system
VTLLLDQGLPRSAGTLLRAQGIDTVHVGDVEMWAAEDVEILSLARLQNRVIVTLDADFHALLALSGAQFPSVIRIRIEGLKAGALAILLSQVLVEWGNSLELGAVVTVNKERMRMRRLPLILNP